MPCGTILIQNSAGAASPDRFWRLIFRGRTWPAAGTPCIIAIAVSIMEPEIRLNTDNE